MRCFAGFVLLLLLASCQQKAPLTRSFYYWKNTGNNWESTGSSHNEGDDSLAQVLGIEHFYIHFLDIDWSEAAGEPVPVFSAENFYHPFYARQDYTPVVFITPRSFAHMKTDADVDSLAAHISRKIARQCVDLENDYVGLMTAPLWSCGEGINYDSLCQARDYVEIKATAKRTTRPTEIQIDCDWTLSTRDRYFKFLKALKARMPGKTLSATIRLYPYKYRQKMGVPPVDRGLLMAYNLSPAGSVATANSILEVTELKRYLQGASGYPLPLDGALPLFGWSVWLRAGRMKGIMHELKPETLGQDYVARIPGAGVQYRVLRDTALSDNYLRTGDVLRDEAVAPEDVEAAAELLRPHIHRLSFFHWDTTVATHEPTLQKIYRRP